MRVLVACEESQEVCKAFRALGHEAYSCDIQECSGGHPEWHIKGDCLPLLNGNCEFKTDDTHTHTLTGKWDLIIAHPPCTYISNAGACRLYPRKGELDKDRYIKGLKGKEFFMAFWWYGYFGCGAMVIENPVPSSIYELPKPTNCIQPYEFGEEYSKKTYLWEFGVPHLMPTELVANFKPYVSCGTSRNKGNKEKSGYSRAGGASRSRSKTFSGVAKAMAEQWGGIVHET